MPYMAILKNKFIMKTRLYFISLITIILCTSCATNLTLADLHPKACTNKKLPSLEPLIDVNSMEYIYSKGGVSTSYNGSTFKTSFGNFVTFGSANSTMYADDRIGDVLTYIDRDVKNSITDYLSKPIGKIYFRTTGYKYSYKPKMGNMLIGSLLLTIPIIAGMNVYGYDSTIELDVEIKNNSDIPVAKYSVIGYVDVKTKGFNTMSVRKLNIMALENAMDKLKQNINNDYDSIIEKLK